MEVNQIPNFITGVRILLVPMLVWLLVERHFALALATFGIMGMSDGLDGFLAKRYNWKTRLGEYLDPLADKIMLVSAYVTLGFGGIVPFWLVITVVLREVVILTGAGVYHLLTHQLQMAPTLISKLNTLAQIILVLTVIFDQLIELPGNLVSILIVLTLITTVASGIGYVIDWSSRAKQAMQGDSH
jgi:cardiolipin synthase